MRKRAADEPAHAAEEPACKAALEIVTRWNAERSVLWSPTIRCAIAAGTPWRANVHCPGCRTSRAIDTAYLIAIVSRASVALSLGPLLVVSVRRTMPVLTVLHALPRAARWSHMPIEFLHGRPLSPDELEMLRQQIEEGFDNITESRTKSAASSLANWPSKLPPEEK